MKPEKIIAVVVTYNRKELLKKCIGKLRENNPSQIIVVNNDSTDGTAQWLETQTDLMVIQQENLGGSGGFYTGIKTAMAEGADWIWCMDDDVFPHSDCLANLLPHTEDPSIGILAPRRLMDGKIFTNDFCRYNLTNPFRSMYQSRLKGKDIQEPTQIAGTAFEGLFISKKAVEEIGYPNKDLFIFCDDTDYCLRTHLAGFRLLYIPEALMDKEHFFNHDTWEDRQQKKKWKRAYQVRNSAYLNHHYGKNVAVRYLRPFNNLLGYLLTIAFAAPLKKGYEWKDAMTLIRAYKDGLAEKLGKM
ncbi:MAG: glycosyltransferase family 2 protein [Bacteroidaceae bacterium]|nr:glycosyltransferase family 2 protein [Bacteroidaceae bacterium]